MSDFDSISNPINKSAFDLIYNSPMSKSIRETSALTQMYRSVAMDASGIIKSSAFQAITSLNMDVSRMVIPMHEQIRSLSLAISESAMSSINDALSTINHDTFKYVSSISETLLNFKSIASEYASLSFTYDQYKPVTDLFDYIQDNILPDSQDELISTTEHVSDSSKSLSLSSIIELKPIPIGQLISIIIALFALIINLHNMSKPNPMPDQLDTLIDLQTQQYNETVRHNLQNEQHSEKIENYLNQIVELLDNTNNEIQEEEQNEVEE
jgi:hypothetical protein